MKKQKAFTLIEVLLVMGILIILIGVGITAARWAIRRSNRIEHMDAARNLEAALIRFKNENNTLPRVANGCMACYENEAIAKLLGYSNGEGELLEYLDETPFNGGGDTTYSYATDDLGQFFVVCVSLGNIDDEDHLGYYCTGTGIGFVPEGYPVTRGEIEPDDDYNRGSIHDRMDDSDWRRDDGFTVNP
jgi:type II secretory pathway pseudopilin PulG